MVTSLWELAGKPASWAGIAQEYIDISVPEESSACIPGCGLKCSSHACALWTKFRLPPSPCGATIWHSVGLSASGLVHLMADLTTGCGVGVGGARLCDRRIRAVNMLS